VRGWLGGIWQRRREGGREGGREEGMGWIRMCLFFQHVPRRRDWCVCCHTAAGTAAADSAAPGSWLSRCSSSCCKGVGRREGGRAKKERTLGFKATAAGTISRDDRDSVEDDDDDEEEGKARQDGGHGRVEGGREGESAKQPAGVGLLMMSERRAGRVNEACCGCACLSLCGVYV